MPRNGSDDEADSCILIGTPLIDLLPEDTKFSTKAKRVEEQIVTDERGKQRFHGAFTGGFSAGYFNSVGSKEGWAPSSFKSSRSEKAKQSLNSDSNQQRPEDFMDEEDFNVHGIAPKLVKVRHEYKEDSLKRDLGFGGLRDVVRSARNTVGVRMMIKMGWREGMGVGPKVKKKLRRMKRKIGGEGLRVYGVAMPSEGESEENDDDYDDEMLVSNFDVDEFRFDIKEDLFGLGYKRLDVTKLLNRGDTKNLGAIESPAASLLFPDLGGVVDLKGKSRRGMMGGQAFGTGDFDDDDDVDVYDNDTGRAGYNLDIGGRMQTDQKQLLDKNYGFDGADRGILEKFVKGSQKQEAPKFFAPPKIPDGFEFKHLMVGGVGVLETGTTSVKSASERADILGEKSMGVESVMDLISESDRRFLEEQRIRQAGGDAAKRLEKQAAEDRKAARYAEFVSGCRRGELDAYSNVEVSGLTEWERQTEKEEFQRIYGGQVERGRREAGSGSAVLSGFVSGEKLDADKGIEVKKEINEIDRAVSEKRFGKETRTVFEFRPHPTLCKRFNLPDPHPNNILKEYGTVTDEPSRGPKSDKFSVFNYMTASSRFEKAKTTGISQVSIFGQLNEGLTPVVKQQAVTVIGGLTGEKIEFDSKASAATVATSIFSDDGPALLETTQKTDDNIYMQERPVEIDLFKAIFEDEEDNEGEDQSEEEDVLVEDDKGKGEVIAVDEEEKVNRNRLDTVPEVVASSIGSINVKDISRYLSKKDGEEDEDEKNIDEPNSVEKIVFRKPQSGLKIKNEGVSVEHSVAKFTELVRSLVAEKSLTASCSDSSSSTTESEYEEVSVSRKKKKSKKLKKGKKKKKSNKSKKSKK